MCSKRVKVTENLVLDSQGSYFSGILLKESCNGGFLSYERLLFPK